MRVVDFIEMTMFSDINTIARSAYTAAACSNI